MTDKANTGTFATVAMAEIYLSQGELEASAGVIDQLLKKNPDDSRVQALRNRLIQKQKAGELVQRCLKPKGRDAIELEVDGDSLKINWELTGEGLDLAKRRVRYSGRSIVRLFTASPGPRGVRTTLRDYTIEFDTATMDITGVPNFAVYTAAVGFLGHSGEFVPMASALPKANF